MAPRRHYGAWLHLGRASSHGPGPARPTDRTKSGCSPALALRDTAFLDALPLPRPDMVMRVVGGGWKGGTGLKNGHKQRIYSFMPEATGRPADSACHTFLKARLNAPRGAAGSNAPWRPANSRMGRYHTQGVRTKPNVLLVAWTHFSVWAAATVHDQTRCRRLIQHQIITASSWLIRASVTRLAIPIHQ